MKNFLTLQSVETVLGHLRALPVLPAETVPLTDALGRRLTEALHAPADLPGFDRSTVDGFAVRARDVFGAQEGSPALLECVGDCPMGAVPDISLQPGQCARILTGGMLPEGADCVVMVEYSRPAGGNMVELTRTQAPGDHVVMRDEDAAAGDCIIPAGRKLRPQEIGLLASFGQKDVTVRRAPRVAIISTGDEVVPIGSEPRPGQGYFEPGMAALAGDGAGCLGGHDGQRHTPEIERDAAQPQTLAVEPRPEAPHQQGGHEGHDEQLGHLSEHAPHHGAETQVGMRLDQRAEQGDEQG